MTLRKSVKKIYFCYLETFFPKGQFFANEQKDIEKYLNIFKEKHSAVS